MKFLTTTIIISSLTATLIAGNSLMAQGPDGWVPEHAILRDSNWRVHTDPEVVRINNRTTRTEMSVATGRYARLYAQDQNYQSASAPKNRPGTPHQLEYGTTSKWRDNGNQCILCLSVGDRLLTVTVNYGMGSTPKSEAMAIAEKLVRAFAARAMALNAKTATNENVNGGNVPGFKITGTGKHVARLAEMSSRLGWTHEFFPDEGYAMLTKGASQVKVFLGSKTVKKNGAEIQLDTPTMEEGGRVFVDRGLIQVLTAS
ncbi:MAG: stalk domain-containing protein [Fimbriimonadaceae bacterium]